MKNLTIEELMLKEHELEMAQMHLAAMFCEIEEAEEPVSDEIYEAVKKNYEKGYRQLLKMEQLVESLIMQACTPVN